jgi:hypothetical protein
MILSVQHICADGCTEGKTVHVTICDLVLKAIFLTVRSAASRARNAFNCGAVKLELSSSTNKKSEGNLCYCYLRDMSRKLTPLLSTGTINITACTSIIDQFLC